MPKRRPSYVFDNFRTPSVTCEWPPIRIPFTTWCILNCWAGIRKDYLPCLAWFLLLTPPADDCGDEDKNDLLSMMNADLHANVVSSWMTATLVKKPVLRIRNSLGEMMNCAVNVLHWKRTSRVLAMFTISSCFRTLCSISSIIRPTWTR